MPCVCVSSCLACDQRQESPIYKLSKSIIAPVKRAFAINQNQFRWFGCVRVQQQSYRNARALNLRAFVIRTEYLWLGYHSRATLDMAAAAAAIATAEVPNSRTSRRRVLNRCRSLRCAHDMIECRHTDGGDKWKLWPVCVYKCVWFTFSSALDTSAHIIITERAQFRQHKSWLAPAHQIDVSWSLLSVSNNNSWKSKAESMPRIMHTRCTAWTTYDFPLSLTSFDYLMLTRVCVWSPSWMQNQYRQAGKCWRFMFEDVCSACRSRYWQLTLCFVQLTSMQRM